MLEVKDIYFHYEKQKQDYRYDFSLGKGEIIAISGVSGAGKSTLLDLIAGFLMPNKGEINLNDQDILSLPPEKRPVSILFQNDNLFEHLSVNKNIALGVLGNENSNENQAAISNALKDVGLENFGNQLASKLSGGQKQRVALARTLLRNRPILLLDEPFTGLDEKTAKDMQALLKKLVKQHKWHAIIVTHNKYDANAMGAKNYVMKNAILQS